jgi:hypothetical protein
MAMTEQQKANALFKKFQGKADTSPYLEFYEEPLKSSFIVTPENFWIDAEYIPNTAPHLQNREEFIVTFENGFQLPVLRRYNNLFLERVPGASSSFYHAELADAIPHDFKDGSYHYTLKDSSGQEIAYGLNAWVVDFQAGVLTFYQGIPEGVALPLTISFYKYIGRKTFEGVIKTDGTTPMVNEYTPSRPQDVTTKKYVDDEVAALQDAVDKLVPETPPNLNTRSLVMQLYKAYEVGTGVEHDCTKEDRPEVHVDGPFYDGDRGILTAFIDGAEISSTTLAFGDSVGVYGGIHITAKVDPYAGENQRKNFHTQLSAFFKPLVALAPGSHTARIQHSITGTTPEKSFWKDDPKPAAARIPSSIPFLRVPTVEAEKPAFFSTLKPSFVSGVPTLTPESFLPITIFVNDIANTHYPNIGAKITSSHVQNEDFLVTNVITDKAAVIQYSQNLRVRPNVYTEVLRLQIVALNSAKDPSSPVIVERNARIDTISNEKRRVLSGPGDFPTNDQFGTAYQSAQNLKDNQELQMIEGIFQWPSGDYSANIPPGPNYNNTSTIPAQGWRWATFRSIDLTYADGFTIHVNGAENWTSKSETNETLGVRIFAKIRNNQNPLETTGWIDCNKPYAGVGKPNKDGDSAMVISGSSATIKRVSFGPTTRSGQLFIRIGLTTGSKRFSTITVTPN